MSPESITFLTATNLIEGEPGEEREADEEVEDEITEAGQSSVFPSASSVVKQQSITLNEARLAVYLFFLTHL